MYNTYLEVIKNNLLQNYKNWDFKSNKNYKDILEHVSYELGSQYMDEIIKNFEDFYNKNKNYLISICELNDLYGKTEKKNFNNFCNCSPSNIRYIFHSLLILKQIENKSLNNIDIVEIGGGYGGLCLFLYKLSPLFNITIKSYTIFDLFEAMLLQQKYLELHNIEINVIDLFSDFTLNNNSFLISNYAYSEISYDLQKIYTQKVLNPYISHGFLVWNFIPFYVFINDKNIICEQEYPYSGNLINFYNCYVYF